MNKERYGKIEFWLNWHTIQVNFTKPLNWHTIQINFTKPLNWHTIQVNFTKPLNWHTIQVNFTKPLNWHTIQVNFTKPLNWHTIQVNFTKPFSPTVNGGWTSFSDVTWNNDCSAPCGTGTATGYKTRACTNPSPAHGGRYCSGSASQTISRSCLIKECPSKFVLSRSSMKIWQIYRGTWCC